MSLQPYGFDADAALFPFGLGAESDTPTPTPTGYDGIYARVRLLLGKPASYITPTPDPLLVMVTGDALRQWLRALPCVTGGTFDYADIPAEDQEAFDAGIAEIIYRRIDAREGATSNSGQGRVVEERSDKFQVKYARSASTAPSAGSVDTGEAVDAAYAQWRTIECVATALASATTFSPFVVASRSRAVCRAGYPYYR